MRFIVDWGAPESATLVIPFGVSGHTGSPHRLDQLPYWRAGDPSGLATRLAGPARETAVFVP
jgi:penicillin amidase